MSSGDAIPLHEAEQVANAIVEKLGPHCERIHVAGSIRRQKPWVHDIEIVCIPKEVVISRDMFSDEVREKTYDTRFTNAVMSWPAVRGVATGNYTQRVVLGKKLDLFMCSERNWGMILAMRTGSLEFSKGLAARWVEAGYHSGHGILSAKGIEIEIREEQDLFDLLGVKFVQPVNREI